MLRIFFKLHTILLFPTLPPFFKAGNGGIILCVPDGHNNTSTKAFCNSEQPSLTHPNFDAKYMFWSFLIENTLNLSTLCIRPYAAHDSGKAAASKRL